MHTIKFLVRERTLVSAGPEETVLEAARRMTNAGVGALPVIDQEQLVGVFSERDIMTRVLVRGLDADWVRVGEVMTREVVTAALEETRGDCLEKMRRTGCRHLPVLAGRQVITMLSMRDLLRDEIQECTEEIRELRAYIHQVPL